MDRPARNPVALPGVYSDPRLSPSEQDVYATAHLFRALKGSGITHNKNPIWSIQMPTASVGELLQLSYIGLRHSS
jgi:hypothetical protein